MNEALGNEEVCFNFASAKDDAVFPFLKIFIGSANRWNQMTVFYAKRRGFWYKEDSIRQWEEDCGEPTQLSDKEKERLCVFQETLGHGAGSGGGFALAVTFSVIF
jgi:hypothetical protein